MASERTSMMKLKETGVPLLAQHAVGAETKRDYMNRIQAFLKWCLETMIAVSMQRHKELDYALAECFDHLHLEQEMSSDTGAKLIAALQDREPSLYKASSRGLLPVTARSLQAWQLLHPGGLGQSIPAEAVAGICCRLCETSQGEAALMTYLCFDTLLRPGALVALRT